MTSPDRTCNSTEATFWAKFLSSIHNNDKASLASNFELKKEGGEGKYSSIQGIVGQKGATLCNQTPLSGNLGGENGKNSSVPIHSDISQGALTASFQGSLTTADGKTKIIKGCEGQKLYRKDIYILKVNKQTQLNKIKLRSKLKSNSSHTKRELEYSKPLTKSLS